MPDWLQHVDWLVVKICLAVLASILVIFVARPARKRVALIAVVIYLVAGAADYFSTRATDEQARGTQGKLETLLAQIYNERVTLEAIEGIRLDIRNMQQDQKSISVEMRSLGRDLAGTNDQRADLLVAWVDSLIALLDPLVSETRAEAAQAYRRSRTSDDPGTLTFLVPDDSVAAAVAWASSLLTPIAAIPKIDVHIGYEVPSNCGVPVYVRFESTREGWPYDRVTSFVREAATFSTPPGESLAVRAGDRQVGLEYEIILNDFDFRFTPGGSPYEMRADLRAVLTRQIGRILGLTQEDAGAAHSRATSGQRQLNISQEDRESLVRVWGPRSDLR